MKPYEITLDLKRNLHQVLVMKEGDANSRIIHVKITDNGKPFDVSANYILIKWRKPDNCVVYNITYTKLDNNTFGIVCTDQMLAVPGIAELEIVIYENETDEVASTMKHNISIEETVIGNKIIESSDEFGALNDMLSKNESLGKDLTELEERLEEGYAEMQETINEMGDLLIEHIDNKENPHNVTKEQLGLSEVENKNSETIRGEITKENVTDALGYTPYTPTEVDNKFSTLETNIDWKEAVETFDDIATTYPAPVDGWTVNVNDTDYTYRYNGVEWISISANAVPLATSSMDGKMSATDKEKLDSIEDNANNYVHPTTSGNKHIPSGGSSGQILKWSADGEATWGGYEGTLIASDVSYDNAASELTSDNVQDAIDEVNNKKQNASTAITTSNIANQSVNYSNSAEMANYIYMPRVTSGDANYLPETSEKSAHIELSSDSVNLPETAWFHLVANRSADTKYGSQLFLGTTSDNMYYRNYKDDVFSTYQKILTSSNYNSYALPLTGGTMSGDIRIINPNTTESKIRVANTLHDGNCAASAAGSFGLYDNTFAKWIVKSDLSGVVTLDGTATYAHYGANNTFSCGNARMYHSEEGGNFRATAPNGVAYGEFDAFNSECARMYFSSNGTSESAAVHAKAGYCEFFLNDSSKSSKYFRYNGNGIYVTTNAVANVGNSDNIWKTVYAKTGTINTSDRNKKHNIEDLTEVYEQLFMKLQPKSFIFNDGDRIHIGAISQDVEDSMKELGLESKDFAGFCKDLKYRYTEFDDGGEGIEETKEVETDEDGNPVYNYSLRYQEFIFLTIHMLQKTIKRLDSFEERLAKLEGNLVK